MTMMLSTPNSPAAPDAPAADAGAPVPSGPPRLMLPKAVAGRYLRNLIDKGVAIRRQRIRYVEDLEDVRGKKSEWVGQYSDVLRQLFSTGAVADACNDWVGRVFPEYAETSLFVEQFYQEMDHRIRRLRAVMKNLAEMPDVTIATASTPAGAAATDAAAAPASDAPAEAAEAVGPTTPQAPGATPVSSPTGGAPAHELFGPAAAAAVAAPEVMSSPVCGILVAQGVALRTAAGPVAKFMEELGVTLISLTAGPEEGGSMLEAYEQGPEASFALIVLSPEDAAALRPRTDGSPAGACRAATAFQLGYFVGRLGVKRVCVLCPGSTDTFRDDHGVSYLPLDTANGWQLQLARHLRRAGIDVDLNRLC